MERTNVSIDVECWRQLNAMKRSPSEEFNDVIRRLLTEADNPYSATESDADAVGPANQRTETTHQTDQEETNTIEASDEEAIEAVIEKWSPQRYHEPDRKKEECGRCALEWLARNGDGRKALFLDARGDELPAVPDVKESTYWQSYVREPLQEAKRLDVVERRDTTPAKWVWVGQ